MPDASSKPFSLSGLFNEILGQCSDLVEKEIELAKAEVTESIATKLSAGTWVGASMLCGFVAILLLVEAIAFALVRAGLPPWGACLVMAAVVGLAAAGLFFKGRAALAAPVLPRKTARNVNRDIETAKEQLT